MNKCSRHFLLSRHVNKSCPGALSARLQEFRPSKNMFTKGLNGAGRAILGIDSERLAWEYSIFP
jgi:hypothetical protein